VSAQAVTPTITTYATMAPNGYGSPSFNTWAENGIYAVENSLSSYGAAGPAQFNITTSPLPVSDNIVTGFQSWLGQAPGPYAGELGNRASFVTVINGNGSLIDMANMGFVMNSSDPGDFLGWAFAVGTWNYDAYDIGVVYDDGHDTAGGVTIVDSGDPDQLVNEIISIGAGNAPASYDTIATGDDDPDLSATDQQIINYDLAEDPSSYDFTGTFTYGDASGSATFDFVATSDASWTWALLAGSFAALASLRRRFNRA
jgi:hypothetical protein